MLRELGLCVVCVLPALWSASAGGPLGATAPSDSLGVGITFSATGGRITAAGLYTAGQRPGTFVVVAAAKNLSDTATVSLLATAGATPTSSTTPSSGSTAASTSAGTRATGVGIPFGTFGAWDGFGLKAGTDAFSLSTGSVDADELANRVAAARRSKHHLLLSMTGGAHDNYKTNGVFDLVKWKARMARYDTPAIKALVAQAVADGTLIGNSVMDEPQNTSADNSWGPAGTLTKARVDEMCGYVKAMFPTLPVGVVHDHSVFEPDKSYRTCDFIVSQYRWSKTKGNIDQFRDEALALGRRDGIAVAFSLNILDGGIPSRRGKECLIPETGGHGTTGRTCRMTPAQIRDWGRALGPAGCALTMWRYDALFMADTANTRAFKDVGATLAKAPGKACRRA